VWTYARIAGVSGGRAYHATVTLADSTLLLIGGNDGSTEKNDVLTLRTDQAVTPTGRIEPRVETKVEEPVKPVKKEKGIVLNEISLKFQLISIWKKFHLFWLKSIALVH
jgi:hypothetical protein